MNKEIVVGLRKLEFVHFVVIEDQEIIFASARIEGKVKNFLIDLDGKWVKQQVNHHFEELPYRLGRIIKERAENFYGKVRLYTIPSFNFLS